MPCGRRNAALFVQIKTLERLQETIGQKLSNPHSAPFLALFRVAGRQKDALAGNGVLEQRHEPGEYNADHDLQQLNQPPDPLDHELCCNRNVVYDQGQVGKIPSGPLADGAWYRYNGRCPQPVNARRQQDYPDR